VALGRSIMGPWVEYSHPDDMFPVHDAVSPPRRARRLISPEEGDAFFVYGEYDDGNGMWIVTGVS
jgi:hypothetical protein